MKSLYLCWLILVSHFALAQISITRPIHNSVLQRDNNNSVNVGIAGQAFSNTNLSSVSIQYRIQKLSPQNSTYLSTPINWTTRSCAYGGIFNFSVNLSGGWYQLDIQSNVTGTQTASVKFGVGEVFVIAGQSNAQGVTASSMYSGSGSSPYDGVVADLHLENTGCLNNTLPSYPSFNPLTVSSSIAPQGPNNWSYTVLGNQLVDNTGVPVAFFNAAQSSTGLRNWEESIQFLNGTGGSAYTSSTYGPTICPTGGAGHPYIALQKTLRFYGSLFGARSVLWHQGENDSHDANAGATTASQYVNRLRTIINQARSDFGHSDLSWWICSVSRTDPTSPTSYATNASILSAQGTVQSDIYNKTGPYTDPIGPRNSTDNIHFSGTGLYDLGNAWYSSIGGGTLTSATPATPNAVLGVTLLGSPSSGFSLQAASGFAQYFWFDTYSTAFNNSPTGQTVSGVGSGTAYQCYARHSNGQWYISPVIRISSAGGARIGLAYDEGQNLGFTVAPNPVLDQTSVHFNLPISSNVILTLVDTNGKLIKQLANGRHADGQFTYPVDLTGYEPGTYLCTLIVNDIQLTKKIVKQAK